MYNEGDFARHVPLKASVTYDGKYSVDVVNGMDIPNNICNNSSYTVTGMSDFKQTFQYTFTEADYEYAVSAGEIIGGNLDVHATNISDIPCACQQ